MLEQVILERAPADIHAKNAKACVSCLSNSDGKTSAPVEAGIWLYMSLYFHIIYIHISSQVKTFTRSSERPSCRKLDLFLVTHLHQSQGIDWAECRAG